MNKVIVSFLKKSFVLSLPFVGLLWGIPWIQASINAASIFPQSSIRTFFQIIFAIGIVITVGVDGFWIMSSNIKNYQPKTNYMTFLIPYLCASLSCIAPVYAAFTYNHGSQRLLFTSIILIVDFGFGLFGYLKLMDKISSPFKTSVTNKEFSAKKIVQCTAAIVFPVATGMINLFLILDFIKKDIFHSLPLALLCAIICSIPSYVVATISSFDIFGRLFDAVVNSWRKEKKKYLVPSIISLTALTAPSAACYITYTTLQNAGINHILLLFATFFIGLNRVVFSAFTLTTLNSTTTLS
jgi:hypothetical protein